MSILAREFYNRETITVARELLGCKLVRKTDNGLLSGFIVETEAYTQDDPACHAYKGKTPRSLTLYKKPGITYIYLIYGMYYCLNFVTEQEGTAGAVLIRALEPLNQLDNTNGPGKLCREMQITKDLHEIDVTMPESEIYVGKYKTIPPENIVCTTRIGIKKAADYPWRFYVKDSLFVSKK